MPRKKNWKKAVVKKKKTGVSVVSDGGLAHPFSPSTEGEPSVSLSKTMNKTGFLVVSDGGLAHPFTPSGASVSESLACSALDSFSCGVLEENLDSFQSSSIECKPMDISEESFNGENALKQKDSVLEFNNMMNHPKKGNIGNLEVNLRKGSQECVYYATPVIDDQSSGIEVFDPSFNAMFNAEKVIFGSFHQGDAMFGEVSRGSQCVVNCVCFLLYAYNNECEITEGSILDTILKDGDCLYNKIIVDLKAKGISKNNLLTFDEIPSVIDISTVKYNIHKSDIISGIAIQLSEDHGLPSLQESLCLSFQLSEYNLVLIGAICSAVFKKDSKFYFFDSHSHGNDCLSACDGTSILLSFKCLEDLVGYMYALYDSMMIDLGSQFEILPISFSDFKDIQNANSFENVSIEANHSHSRDQSVTKIKGIHDVTDAAVASCENNLIDRYFKDQKEKESSKKDAKRGSRNEYYKEYKRKRRLISEFKNRESHLKRLSRKSIDQRVKDRESTKTSKSKAREKAGFRLKELINKQESRKRIEQKEKDKAGTKKSMEKARESTDFRLKELISKQESRKRIEQKEKDKAGTKKSMDKARESTDFKLKELMSKQESRKRMEQKEKDKAGTKKSMDKARESTDFKLKELISKQESRKRMEQKEKDKAGTKKSKDKARRSADFKLKELISKQESRKRKEQKQKDKAGTKKSMDKARESAEFRLKEVISKQESRRNTEQKEKDKCSTKQSKEKARKYAEFRMKELESKRSLRQNTVQKEKDKAFSMVSMKRARKDEKYRMKEVESKRKARRLATIKAREIIYQRASKKKARSDPYTKEKERVKKQEWRSYHRNKNVERLGDAGRKALKRRNPDFQSVEISAAKQRKYGSNIDNCIKCFEANIANGPIFICSCCHQTWFKQSVSVIKSDSWNLPAKYLTNLKSVDDKEWICSTCKTTVSSGKVPKLSVINGMAWPEKPRELDLHPLEERLIALRIPFMQIRELPRGRQLSIKGNVINVPMDIQPVVNVLPRPFNENVTVAVKLKKKISYKSCVFSENVRPLKVLVALDWLMKTSDLYRNSSINIDHHWIKQVNEQRDEVVDEFFEAETVDNDRTCTTSGIEQKVEELYDSDAEEVSQENVGNIDTMVQDTNEENRNCMFTFAPGEGQQPLSIYQDKDSEYLCFPTIFCGKRRKEHEERLVPVQYSDIAKWELRSRDRRAANSVPNIFFKLKKLQMKQLSDKVNLAVRRCQVDGHNMTAAKAKDSSYLDNFVKKDEGYYIFKQLRNSPAYLERRKKDVFAMIRQLGLPTWFMSLSSADTRWPDLLKMLSTLNEKAGYSDEEIENLTWEQKISLIQKDPVTCSRYFDHRVQEFINIVLKSVHEPLGKLADFFYRVEFQQRGSPHIHMLVWIENAPKFNKHSNEEIAAYVDKYLQCSNSEDNIKHLTDLQVHKHSRTCRKKQDKLCRFGYPLPPLQRTEVLDPLEEDKDKYQKKYNELQKTMNDEKDGYDLSYEEFLQSVANMTETEYIKCVRSSLAAPKVFLQRKPSEIRVNMYNRNVLKAWKANIDIQFVLDPYACAVYIVSYISKSQRGMSNLLHAAAKEARNGNLDIKRQVRHIGNVFSNSVEVSAQEAVYLVLQMPLTKSTRDVTFINTSTPDKRVQLLKSKNALDELPDHSTDIMSDNIFKRYARRPKALSNWCLADYVSQLDVSHPDQSTIDQNEEHNEDEIEFGNEQFNSDVTILSLRNGITIRRRKTNKVIRYVRFNKRTDEENHFREKLLLFHPWKDEEVDLLSRYSSYKEHYESIKHIIDHKCSQYEHHVDELEAARELADAEYDAYDEVAPGTQQVEADTAEEQPVESEQFIYFNPDRVSEHREYDIGNEIGCSVSSAQVNVNESILSDDEYRKLLRCLNSKQKQFYNHVIHWIKTKDSPLYAFLSGGAGVGKSVVIRALYQTLYRMLNLKEGENTDNIRILLCAYTGKAAFNIGGSTISSAFKQKYKQSNQTLTCDSLNTFRSKYRDLSVVIIDEISMVSCSMLSFIDQRLQELKGTRIPFGGVSVIAVGDLYQLKPVTGDWIFNDMTHGASSLSTNLWKDHFKIFELNVIMRQKDDKEFAEMLNRLRVDALTNEDKMKLEKCKVSKDQDNYQVNAPHLFAENYFMHLFNESIINSLDTEKVIIPSHDSVISPSLSKEKQERAVASLPTDPNNTANLHSSLTVVVNMIYDLTVNINTEDGLANGASCTVKFIEYKISETNRPSVIWVHFHEESAGFETRVKFKNRGFYHGNIDVKWTPVFDVERTYVYNKKTFQRIQFPLQPSAGRSVHRAQGSTLDSVVIDLSQRKTRKVPHLHYVAVSRVKSMDKLQLINFNEKAYKIDNQVQIEMDRLLREAKLDLCFTPFESVDPNGHFKVSFNNCRSLHLHYEDVKADQSLVSSHVFGLAETRLHKHDHTTDYDIDGFHLIRNDQDQSSRNRPAHGLCIYVKKTVKVTNHVSYSSKTVEFILINVAHGLQSYQLVFLYKSPTSPKQHFIACLEHNLFPHLNKTEQLVIMGDFNINYSQANDKIWKEIQSKLSCKVLNEASTTDYMSILDVVLSNCHGKVGILEAYWSDHKIVHFHSL